MRCFFIFSCLLRSLFYLVFSSLFLFLIQIVNADVFFLLFSFIVVQLSFFFFLCIFGFLSIFWLCFNNFFYWLLSTLLSSPDSNLLRFLLKCRLFFCFQYFNMLLLDLLLNNFSWLRLYFWFVSKVTKLHSHFFCFTTRIMS